MEAEIISPISNSLLLHVEAGRKPNLFRRIVGVVKRLLFWGKAEKLVGNVHHFVDRLGRNSVVKNLPKKPKSEAKSGNLESERGAGGPERSHNRGRRRRFDGRNRRSQG